MIAAIDPIDQGHEGRQIFICSCIFFPCLGGVLMGKLGSWRLWVLVMIWIVVLMCYKLWLAGFGIILRRICPHSVKAGIPRLVR